MKAFLFTLITFVSIFSVSCSNKNVDARKIHKKAITIDTHCDTPMQFLKSPFDIGQVHNAPESRVDLPRMEEGGVDAMFFAMFTSQRKRTPQNYEIAYKTANQMIDSTKKAIETNKDRAVLALNSQDAEKISRKGKRAIYLGMENGFPLGMHIERVKEFYNKGVRYITLCHTKNNDICDSSTDEQGAEHHGVSEFGIEVIKEMNRLGMMIDVSHISDTAFNDVLQYSSAPVIASHSSVRSICDHPRNMDDDMIKALAKKGGVIQICLLGAYIYPADTTSLNHIKKEELRTKYNNWNYASDEQRIQAWKEWDEIDLKYPPVLPSIAQAVDHIDHVVELVGIDYVGIGSDFDGGGALSDCADVADFPKITEELVRRGYSEEDIIKIWGGNFLRVFKAVEDLKKS